MQQLGVGSVISLSDRDHDGGALVSVGFLDDLVDGFSRNSLQFGDALEFTDEHEFGTGSSVGEGIPIRWIVGHGFGHGGTCFLDTIVKIEYAFRLEEEMHDAEVRRWWAGRSSWR